MRLILSGNSFVSLISGVLAISLSISYLALTRAADQRRLGQEISALKNPVRVITAVKDLNRGTKIAEEDLKTKKIPKAFLPDGYVSDDREVIGKETVVEIFQGEALSSRKLSKNKSRRASMGIRAGRVAVAVDADEVAGVAGGIRPGDRVDIIFTDEDTGRTEILYKRVPVIGIGGVYPFSRFEGQKDQVENVSNLNMGGGSTVVVEVTSAEAADLTDAAEQGQLKLALRAAES